MSESQELEPAPEQPESREDELTRRVARWVEGPLVTVMTLILLYYGGNAYGDSRYISHPLWQGLILLPIVAAGFAILVIDRAGRKRPPRPERQARREAMRSMTKAERRAARIERTKPQRRVSRWIARRLIARQEQKGISS